MKLWNELKRQFHKITPLELASAELVEAEIKKLEAETAQEFAAAAVAYNTARIIRLKKYINALTKEMEK
jgi:transcriptional antiterminator Rof (Rho-off)